MNKFARISSMCVVMVLGLASAAFAQDAATTGGLTGGKALIEFGGAFGVGLTVIGAAYGIGKLASSALESCSVCAATTLSSASPWMSSRGRRRLGASGSSEVRW